MGSSDKSQPQKGEAENVAKPTTSANTGTLYLVLTQVASRALTFAGNQFLLRYLSPSQLGLAVQLELVSVTVLYTSRESLRVALQRRPAIQGRTDRPTTTNRSNDSARTLSQEAINLAYLVLLVGLCASYVFGHGYLRHSGLEVLQSTDFWLAFKLYALATCIELLAEPSFAVIQQHSLYKARARAETGASVARCLSACLTAILLHSRQKPSSVLPFAVGQLCYAGTLFTLYLAAVLPVANVDHFSLLPRKLPEAQTNTASNYWLGLFSAPLLTLTTTFYAQSVFKLFLTQGDSFILSLAADLKSQGAFALASNYGGLLSRLLFQPVEESSRNIFGRLLTSVDHPDAGTSSTHSSETKQDEKFILNDALPSVNSKASTTIARSNIDLALSHLTTTLHLYTLFSLPILSLLPHLLPPLITTLIGPRWSNPATTTLLSAYPYYLPFLALNGILDAFVTSVASPRALREQSLTMLFITIFYGLLAWILISPPEIVRTVLKTFGCEYQGVGPAGLVYANILNMALRIAYSIGFISAWIEVNACDAGEWKNFQKRSLPSLGCVATAILVAGGLSIMVGPNEGTKNFVGIKGLDVNDVGYLFGGVVVLGSSILAFEHQFLLSMLSAIVPRPLFARIAPYLPKQKAQ